MSDRFFDWLAWRSGRERVLMALCVAVALPLLFVFAVLVPLYDSRTDALDARNEARDLDKWVRNRAASARDLALVAAPERPDPIGSTGIEASLERAGLLAQVSDLSVGEGGVIALQFDEVVFTTLADWLSRESDNWGYELGSFRIDAQDAPGRVSARFVLRPAA